MPVAWSNYLRRYIENLWWAITWGCPADVGERERNISPKTGEIPCQNIFYFDIEKLEPIPCSPLAPLEPRRRGDVVFPSAAKALECVRLSERHSISREMRVLCEEEPAGRVGLHLRLWGAELRWGWSRGGGEAPAARLPPPAVSTWVLLSASLQNASDKTEQNLLHKCSFPFPFIHLFVFFFFYWNRFKEKHNTSKIFNHALLV